MHWAEKCTQSKISGFIDVKKKETMTNHFQTCSIFNVPIHLVLSEEHTNWLERGNNLFKAVYNFLFALSFELKICGSTFLFSFSIQSALMGVCQHFTSWLGTCPLFHGRVSKLSQILWTSFECSRVHASTQIFYCHMQKTTSNCQKFLLLLHCSRRSPSSLSDQFPF